MWGLRKHRQILFETPDSPDYPGCKHFVQKQKCTKDCPIQDFSKSLRNPKTLCQKTASKNSFWNPPCPVRNPPLHEKLKGSLCVACVIPLWVFNVTRLSLSFGFRIEMLAALLPVPFQCGGCRLRFVGLLWPLSEIYMFCLPIQIVMTLWLFVFHGQQKSNGTIEQAILRLTFTKWMPCLSCHHSQ